jgi:hypothetical protein
MKTFKVAVENEYHLYKIGTVVKPLFPWGHYSDSYAWYVDEEGVKQLMRREELEEVV